MHDGYLHFKDVEAFSEVTSYFCNLDDETRKGWEDKHNFKSQRRIMQDLITAEDEFEKICIEKYAGQDISNLPDETFHSERYKYYLAKNVIKELHKGTSDQYFDLSICNVSLMDFVNEDGLFAIGDSLYHADENRLAVLTDGSFDKKQLYNTSLVSTNDNVSIIQNTMKLKAGNWRSPGWITPNGGEWKREGNQRIGLKVLLDVKQFIVSTPAKYEFYHDVHVQTQKRNWLGRWKYETTQIWIEGNWEMSIFNKPLILHNSYSWNGRANYFKASINPQTGSTSPYRSYFSVSSPHPSSWDDQKSPIYKAYYWSATRWGGASGITQTMQD